VLWTEGLQSLPADYAAGNRLLGRSLESLIPLSPLIAGSCNSGGQAETVGKDLLCGTTLRRHSGSAGTHADRGVA